MEVKNCGNCYKAVSSENILSHEAYCTRHRIACPTCGELVHRYCFNEHIKLRHVKKLCFGCRGLFWQFNLDSHMRVCDYDQDTDIELDTIKHKEENMKTGYQSNQYNNCFFHSNSSGYSNWKGQTMREQRNLGNDNGCLYRPTKRIRMK